MMRKNRRLIPKSIGNYLSYDPSTGHIRRIKTLSGAKLSRNQGMPLKTVSCGYIMVLFDYKLYYAHRIAWFLGKNEQPPEYVVHINGDKRDNRLENLREADLCELTKDSKWRTHRAKGVGLESNIKIGNSRYRSRLCQYYARIAGSPYVGRFKSSREAKDAVRKAQKEIDKTMNIQVSTWKIK